MHTKELSSWCTQVGKTRQWTDVACEQEDLITLPSTSLEKSTVPRYTRQHRWHPFKWNTNKSRKESSDAWLRGASIHTRALDACIHWWFRTRFYQEWMWKNQHVLPTFGQPASKPFPRISSPQTTMLKQRHYKQRPNCLSRKKATYPKFVIF